MEWTYRDTDKIIDEVPKNAYGFIYIIYYEDGTKYIGKKNFYSIQTKPRKKDNQKRSNHVRFTYKIKNNTREYKEVIRQETDWRTYTGSSKEIPKDLKIIKKKIIAIVNTKIRLTYLEAKFCFNLAVLEQEEYRNTNVLGSFYQGRL